MRRAVRVLLYAGPLLLAGALTLALATSLGDYRVSWTLTARLLDAVAPGHAPISDYGVTRYQINDAVRTLAHVGLYALAAGLAARAARWGRPDLPGRALLAALAFAALLTGAESAVRLRTPTRHVRPIQLLWNLAGVALGAGAALAGDALRRAERWAWREEPDPDTPKQAP